MIELAIALGAGLISFLSPCVLPLIPGYISYISGSSLNELIEKKNINYHQVPLYLCTDNAAMIGWNAIEILQTRKIRFNNYNIRPTPNILIHENF